MTLVLADDLPTPGGSSAQSPVSAPTLNPEALRGTWHIDMKVGGVSVKGSTEYIADGTFQGAATYILDDEKTELTMKGTWKLEGQTLITTITQSSNPELLSIGEVSKDKILELSDSTLRYRDENGLVVRETREDTQVKPPAKSPGRPVSAEEFKAINAAIAAMQRSFRGADYDGIVKGTHPSVIAESGGDEKFRKSLEKAVSMMQNGDLKISDDQLEMPAELHDAADEWVCFVPKRNTIEYDGRKVRSQGFYVAVRKKTSEEWKLLDGAGSRNNPEMLWTLLPDLPRGVAVPAVKREVIAE